MIQINFNFANNAEFFKLKNRNVKVEFNYITLNHFD